MAVPKIRFPEFTDDWEQRKLGDIASSFAYGLNAAAKEFDGKHKYLRITDIDDVSRVFQDDNLTSPDADIDAADDYRLEEGDLLFARTGASVGKSYIYKESDGLVYYAGFLIRAKIRPEYDAEFVFQNTLTSTYEKYIKTTSQRSGQPGVNAKEYAEYSMSLPEYAEQVKIGMFLRKIDDAITLHQRKLDDLRLLKKSMLQKMFPKEGKDVPETRFPGFTDAWEQRKFGDVFEEYSEKNHEDLPPLTIVQGSGTIPREESGRDIKYDKSSLNNYKLVNPGDFILHLRSFEGGLEVANSQGIVSPAYHIFRGIRTDSRFYYPFFRSHDFINILLKPHVYGIRDGKSIDVEGMKSIKIPYPDFDEQKRIGDFFDHLDNAITLHQRKRDDLKDLKRVFLYRISLKSPSRRRIWQDELL